MATDEDLDSVHLIEDGVESNSISFRFMCVQNVQFECHVVERMNRVIIQLEVKSQRSPCMASEIGQLNFGRFFSRNDSKG